MNAADSKVAGFDHDFIRRALQSPLVTPEAAERYVRAGYFSTMFAVLAALTLVQLGQAGLGASALCVCGVFAVQVLARRHLRETMQVMARRRGAARPELMARVELRRLLRR